MKTFYDILKISRNASREEILEAYRKRCIETHPDKGGKEIDFLNVRKGYEILSNPTKRACLLYTSPSPRDRQKSRMPSSA